MSAQNQTIRPRLQTFNPRETPRQNPPSLFLFPSKEEVKPLLPLKPLLLNPQLNQPSCPDHIPIPD